MNIKNFFDSAKRSTLNVSDSYPYFCIMLGWMMLSLFGLGHSSIHEWDEARHAQNALEMMRQGRYFELYYGGQPDRWNLKPPLGIWFILASFNLFGIHAWSLRISSCIASLALIIYAFRFSKLWFTTRASLVIVFILLTSKGIIGNHSGRTADMDSLLLLSLAATGYYVAKARLMENSSKVLNATKPKLHKFSVFAERIWFFKNNFGLLKIYFWLLFGFGVKGWAVFQIFPLLLLLLPFFCRQEKIEKKDVMYVKIRSMLDFRNVLVLSVGFLGLGLVLFLFMRRVPSVGFFWKSFLIDVWTRFTTPIENNAPTNFLSNVFWLPQTLIQLNSPWIYVCLGLWINLIYQQKSEWLNTLRVQIGRKSSLFMALILLAMLPLTILLAFAKTKVFWYAIPIVYWSTFFIIPLFGTAKTVPQRAKKAVFACILVLAFALQVKRVFRDSGDTKSKNFVAENSQIFKKESSICYKGKASQVLRFYISALNSNYALESSKNCKYIVDVETLTMRVGKE